MRTRNEKGIALITVLLLLMLVSAMLIATTAMVVKDSRARFQDHDRTSTFYVAHAGLEKITNDLGDKFAINYSPTTTDLNEVMASRPTLGNMTWDLPGGATGSGYRINKGATENRTITTGDFAGLKGLITPYRIQVTARSSTKAESSLERTVNTIAIPIFQFGIFSETDLSFFPGPYFNFGGRVHTNGNLFLAKGNGTGNDNLLILADKVTAYKDVIRTVLSNGHDTNDNYQGEVRIQTTEGGCTNINATTCRNMPRTEGSVDNIGGSTNSLWPTISLGPSPTRYNGNIKTGAGAIDPPGESTLPGTGATRLNLPIASGTATAIDLIRRPVGAENTSDPTLFEQRYYSLASVRILLSDRAADLDNLAGHASGTAQNLATYTGNGAGYPGTAQAGTQSYYKVPSGTPLITGFIKVEMQNKAGDAWSDVTTEFLNRGITGRQLNGSTSCSSQVQSGAIIRLQRVREDGLDTTNCSARTNFWPASLYDAREAALRDDDADASTYLYVGGIMHYVELDIGNLRNWLKTKRTADAIMETTGYVVYFSDRRGNQNGDGGPETGEYGFEDFVYNNGSLDTGEDVNGNGTQQTYGQFPSLSLIGATTTAPLTAATRPYTVINDEAAPATAIRIARANRPVLFRRALKLVNGYLANMVDDSAGKPKLGLTVVAENPVYIQGDYNADIDDGVTSDVPNSYGATHVACAVIADAVTLLSNAWNDVNSFTTPYNTGTRTGTNTVYRTAIVSGKGPSFPKIGTVRDFGTDGGTHNFLRYLENWGSTLYYRGSIVSLYYNRQATGSYKCCTNVYGPPTRRYVFDDDFLDPAKLPPRTPMFRTIDVTSFTRLQEPPTP